MKDPKLSIRPTSPLVRTTRRKSYAEELQITLAQSLQWVAFEPNGEALWAKVRGTVADYLINDWKKGVLLGTKPEQAFFVKCDRTTMTQADLDGGCLICLVGVAPVRPAEFIIFRIEQNAAGRKV